MFPSPSTSSTLDESVNFKSSRVATSSLSNVTVYGWVLPFSDLTTIDSEGLTPTVKATGADCGASFEVISALADLVVASKYTSSTELGTFTVYEYFPVINPIAIPL